MGHEVIHACMIRYHRDTIASVKKHFGEEGKNAYMEYLSYQWEFDIYEDIVVWEDDEQREKDTEKCKKKNPDWMQPLGHVIG